MKLIVEKTPEGLKLQFASDPARKPIVIVLNPKQIDDICSALKFAVEADALKFSIDL